MSPIYTDIYLHSDILQGIENKTNQIYVNSIVGALYISFIHSTQLISLKTIEK